PGLHHASDGRCPANSSRVRRAEQHRFRDAERMKQAGKCGTIAVSSKQEAGGIAAIASLDGGSAMLLEGKVALITGGGSGVGAAIARQFAQAGAQVIVVGRRAEQLQATCDAITSGKPARPIVADVADRAQVTALAEQIVSEFGRLDILVNNAGVNTPERRLDQLSGENWDLLMNVNATGAFNMIQAVLPQMRSQGDGLIINISSISGLRPSALAGAAYSASKHALNALSKVVSQEEEEHGIRS